MFAPALSRRAGLLVPLFSIPSSRSWGIGEIGDLDRLTGWLEVAGIRLLQLLPISESSPGEPSPYGALSAMAIDPQFVTMDAVEDFATTGGESALDSDIRRQLDGLRGSTFVRYGPVKAVKQAALRLAFAQFRTTEWATDSTRARALRAFIEAHAWWLEDYALFRALHARYDERPWTDWPAPVRSREPAALARARVDLQEEVLFRQYVQWNAGDQWAAARARAGGVALFGDLPFMVSGDSADVWARQDEFDLDRSVGTPPDEFSATGQDWGLPPPRWDLVASRGFEWLHQRARRMATLFDGCRVDHLVGFYRTFTRSRDGGEGVFTPAEERDQVALGERVLDVVRTSGLEIVAEDLGVVPNFVRASLARLGVPGYKVMRWERRWHDPGQPFIDPADYPAVALATSGTHDMESMAVWWEHAPADEREAVLAIPSVRARLADVPGKADGTLSPRVRDAILEALYASGADLLVLPVQDVFGWRDRINTPGTVGDHNWTWCLPWPVDRLAVEPEASAAAARLLAWSMGAGR